MRITVVYEDARYPLDVKPDDKVADLKEEVRDKLVEETAQDKRLGRHLEFSFGGAVLQSDWVLNDISIISGSVIKCNLKTIKKPNLLIYLAYRDNEVLQITDPIDTFKTTVADLKSMIAEKLGLPVSIFRLTFDKKYFHRDNSFIESVKGGTPKSTAEHFTIPNIDEQMEIFDSNVLDYYGVEIGSKIRLDLWDGWNELVLAAILGHERVVRRYFSFNRSIRQFQQRVALYIAADRGHIGLATSMMKYGTKAHEPVGLFPGRKWCYESEHPENKICPLHRACVRGHLPLLRLFIKQSPLCFITQDNLGRTPLQIVMHYRNRACFEFLVARQWGRKTGKNISLPLVLFCRILRWSEHAKRNVLLMHGANKSTLRGIPSKNGALVGCSELVIDGFGSKPANSLSFSEVNHKAPINSDRMMSVVLAAKQQSRLLANKSKRRNRLKPPVSESSKLPLLSAAKSFDSASSVFNSPSMVSFNDAESVTYNHGHLLVPKAVKAFKTQLKSSATAPKTPLKSSLKANSKPSDDIKYDNLKLPIIQTNSYDANEISAGNIFSFTAEDLRSHHHHHQQLLTSDTSIGSRRSWPPPRDRHPIMNFKKENTDPGIPLPARSSETRLRPFFYWSTKGGNPDPVRQTLAKFQTYRGMASRQHAIKCVALSTSFTEKPWLEQIRMAALLSKRGVKKVQTLPMA